MGFLSHSLFVPLIAVRTLQLITLTRRELVSVKGFSSRPPRLREVGYLLTQLRAWNVGTDRILFYSDRIQLQAQSGFVGIRGPHAVIGFGKFLIVNPVRFLGDSEVLHHLEVRRGAGEVQMDELIGVRRHGEIEGVREVGDLQPFGDTAHARPTSG